MRIRERTFRFPDGREALIRSAGPEDAELVRAHREATSAETHFMAREPEDGQPDPEKTRTVIEAVDRSETDFHVTAFLDGEVIGDLGVTQVRPHVKYAHRAYLGMSVRAKYTGLGLGTFLLRTAIAQAEENGFEQVELGVFSDNARAIHVYEKLGFREYGRTPRAFKLKDGTYRDELIMVRFLR